MKLKNKLLPLVGIAATAAVVAPLVTSCSEKMVMVDITRGYTPKTKASVAGELTQQQATQTYIDDVKKNPDIFKEDFIYGVYRKVLDTKTEFMNSVNYWSIDRKIPTFPSGNTPTVYQAGFISAANFKVNSLKVGVSTPKFGSTEIAYPGEPKITYPTISFEYKIQIDYTYEYLGKMYDNGNPDTMFGSNSENVGYHSRTIALETNIKYNNVPFLAIAKNDGTELSETYWQITPFDTQVINSKESKIDTIHYYSQVYMFQYMTDDWSIDIDATANVENKDVNGSETEVTTSTPTFSLTINDYTTLLYAMASAGRTTRNLDLNYFKSYTTPTNSAPGKLVDGGEVIRDLVTSDTLNEVYSYDLANYYDMMINFANFGFQSYYFLSVEQKPEIQTNGNMQGGATIATATTTKASFGEFYLPQTFKGTIKLYAGLDTAGKPTGAITLNSTNTELPLTLTIAEGAELTQHSASKTSTQYGVVDQSLTWDESKTPATGYWYFTLPKTIVAEFTPAEGTAWTQVVYLNQNSLPIELK